MFTFAYQVKAPHLIYRVVSKDGVIGEPVPITIPACVMMHDFSITENYALFMDLPLRLNPMVTSSDLNYTQYSISRGSYNFTYIACFSWVQFFRNLLKLSKSLVETHCQRYSKKPNRVTMLPQVGFMLETTLNGTNMSLNYPKG